MVGRTRFDRGGVLVMLMFDARFSRAGWRWAVVVLCQFGYRFAENENGGKLTLEVLEGVHRNRIGTLRAFNENEKGKRSARK